jgi:hypothetical protein
MWEHLKYVERFRRYLFAGFEIKLQTRKMKVVFSFQFNGDAQRIIRAKCGKFYMETPRIWSEWKMCIA